MRTTTIGLHGYLFTVTHDEDGIESVELELTAEQRLDFTAAEILAIEQTARASLDRDPTPVYGWQQSRPGPMGVLPAGW